jgi:hypothetical protein
MEPLFPLPMNTAIDLVVAGENLGEKSGHLFLGKLPAYLALRARASRGIFPLNHCRHHDVKVGPDPYHGESVQACRPLAHTYAEHPRSEGWSFPCLFCGTQVTRVVGPI